MKNRTKALLATLLAVGCSMAYAASYNRTPNATFANASTVCGAIQGNQCFITDCLTDACVVGGGSVKALSQYNGSAWVVVSTAAAGGAGAIAGTTANTFDLDTDGDNIRLDPQARGLSVYPQTTGSSTFDLRDYADTTDDDMAHTLFTTNCTDTGSASEDCDFTIGIVEAGAAAETRLNFDADLGITLGSANTDNLTVSTNNNGVKVLDFGVVNIDLRDADNAITNRDNVRLGANCTDTGDGSEDCDFTLGVQEAGAAAETRLNIDADGGITLGSANNNSLTVTTDSTGDAEVVLPVDSVGAGELSDAACTSVRAVSYNPTEAGATDDYVSLVAVDTGTGDASFGATETSEDQFIVPVAMIGANLRVDTATAPGVGNDAWVITLREAAGATALTCTIDEAATSCTDVANLEAIAAGAAINFQVTSSTGGGADPTASAEMRISFCLTAD
jgi:hypothetical protein